MTNELIQYIRDDCSRPFGVLVAQKQSNDAVVIGWSICNEKYDFFSKELGKEIARGRIKAWRSNTRIPSKIAFNIVGFASRVKKYFRAKEVHIYGANQ